ncbi:MAG: metal ABC transporter permease [Planctomycetaceae bacterium]|nr:MAG: metal ABC transporter permease [Planctomycetaceae bacterium]
MFDLTPIYDFIARAIPLECMQVRFMQQAFIGIVLLAPMCAAMGVQVVNFRMAFFSDAISHSAFAGVAIGLLLAMNVRLSMLGLALLIGVMIVAVGRRSSLSIDTIIGVFFSAVVAFGLAVVSRERHIARDLQMFLYGDILTIGNAEILWEAVLFVSLMAFQFFGYNRMLYVGLNPVLATAHRVRTRVYQYAYAALLSLVVIFSVWAVGVFLVTAMLIVPAATARNLARSAAGMFWWSIVVGLTSAVAGLLISAQPDVRTATGATVILCASVWFVISFIPTFVRRGASGRYPANGGSSGT